MTWTGAGVLHHANDAQRVSEGEMYAKIAVRKSQIARAGKDLWSRQLIASRQKLCKNGSEKNALVDADERKAKVFALGMLAVWSPKEELKAIPVKILSDGMTSE